MNSARQLRHAETALAPLTHWTKRHENGVWYACPPGYRYGFATSTTEEGIDRAIRSIRNGQGKLARRLIWC